jgi:hypothetical protein
MASKRIQKGGLLGASAGVPVPPVSFGAGHSPLFVTGLPTSVTTR